MKVAQALCHTAEKSFVFRVAGISSRLSHCQDHRHRDCCKCKPSRMKHRWHPDCWNLIKENNFTEGKNMAETASDLLMDILIDWRVEVVFGLPGDGINGLMEALRKRKDKIRFIQVRHEEAAAFMACAYAKYTGRLGVCLATSGPGGIHLLNGLYDAKLDG